MMSKPPEELPDRVFIPPTIRVALPEDVVAISKMWLKFMQYNAMFDSSFEVKPKVTARFAREIQDRLEDSNYRIAVAEIDNGLVGYCFSYVSRKPYFFRLGKFGFIGDLFVEETYRRRGIGRMLVNDAHAFFERRGIEQVELLVAAKNIDTIKFWEKLGYIKLLEWMYRKR
ncbi:MAG: GNAT family N-acetyltransferase [candidate division Zixibacteria bacterium]|jgi:GNAT superfamily N-acetyltransferase|nr:GNAT family N-acetyltransferase [candidate division Zixibacteria bacterium]